MSQSAITREEAAQELLLRRKAQDSLLGFTTLTHHGFVVGEHHRIICEKLEQVERGELDRLMVFTPPRHGKSELISVRFPAWFLGRNANKQIITVSYAEELATDFGRQVRNLIASSNYQRVFDDVTLASDSRSANRWHTSNGGSYMATSVGGSITGKGADVMCLDDLHRSRADANSESNRQRVWDAWQADMQTRLMPGGRVILVMTRWHEDDIAGRLIHRGKKKTGDAWDVVSLPAIINENTPDEQALWPEWFTLESMRRRRDNMTPRDWAALYQQQPRPPDGSLFKTSWFKRFRPNTQPPDLSVYITTDFAVKGSGGDFTEFAVWGIDSDDNAWALDWYYAQATPDTWVEHLLQMIRYWSPLAVFGEGGPLRRAVEPFLLKRMRETRSYARMVWLNSGKNKATRVTVARGFQARCAMGKVWLPSNAWGERVVDQLLAFPHSKYDDAVDCCSLLGIALLHTHSPQSSYDDTEDAKVDAWSHAFADVEPTGADFWRVC